MLAHRVKGMTGTKPVTEATFQHLRQIVGPQQIIAGTGNKAGRIGNQNWNPVDDRELHPARRVRAMQDTVPEQTGAHLRGFGNGQRMRRTLAMLTARTDRCQFFEKVNTHAGVSRRSERSRNRAE